MLPLYPPYAIADFAHEGRLLNGKPRRDPDPEGVLDDAALLPAPGVTGLRRRTARSRISALLRLFDRRNDVGRTTAA